MKNGDLIWRQALHDELTIMAANGAKSHIRAYARCVQALELAPAVDAEPVRHGRWFFDSGIDYCEKCTECKSPKPPHYISDNYCPNCGVKMDGDKDA